MPGIRFTKGERELLLKLLGNAGVWTKAELAAHSSILAKLERSDLTKGTGKLPGIGWVAAANEMRKVLGDKLATPPKPDIGWMVKMNNRIRDLGLTPMNCASIARVLFAKGWRIYSFEKAIWQADTLLAEAQLELPGVKRDHQPMEMEDI